MIPVTFPLRSSGILQILKQAFISKTYNEVKRFLLYILSGTSSAQESKPSILKNEASMSKISREKLLRIAGKIDSRDKISMKMCLDD